MTADGWRWGNVPEGFAKIERGRQRWLVRAGLAEVFYADDPAAVSSPSDGAALYHGRAPLRAIKLPDGGNALVRRYLHGGALGFITGGCFFTWPPRPFRELAITVELRRRGLPTVEPCGAGIEKLAGPFYRGWLATREIEGAADLWAALQNGFARAEGLDKVLQAVALSLHALHRQGVCHGDLNLKNILIRREAEGLKAYIIDFDKAVLFLGPVPQKIAAGNLARLQRSVRKLDSARRYLSEQDWNKFVSCYHGAAG
ncbi:MAG: hypothetical protein FJ145_03045 [Deltaproteobacteria bacterium]|nr:hypothetical protein [Deltaproteobacteria bacterium]